MTVTSQDNIKSLSIALDRLVEALVRSQITVPIQEMRRLQDALTRANDAQKVHQDWLLSDRQ